jgi:SAM-dependent methyltransferase
MSRRERARLKIEDRVYRAIVGEPPDGRWQRLISFLTEQGYASTVLRRRLGLRPRLDTTDRYILEQTIFGFYRHRAEFNRVLFVGCGEFTAHYQRSFFADKEYWTVEAHPALAKYGSTRHVVARIEDASKQSFAAGYFDVIFCNGLYGWGMDTAAQGEAVFSACHASLRDGGHLIVGWNDLPQLNLFDLGGLESRRAFKPLYFAPLASTRYLTKTKYRHVFDFHQK